AGALDVSDRATLGTDALSEGVLNAAAMGRDYGVVGLLEISPEWDADRILYIWDAAAFLLEDDARAIEVTTRLGLYPDLVIGALPVRADAELFGAEERVGAYGDSPADDPGPPSKPVQLELVGEGGAAGERQETSDA